MADVRSPQLETTRRGRRRGPRSMHAIIRRQSNRLGTERGFQPPRDGGLCEFKPEPSQLNGDFTLLSLNIRGFVSHSI